MLHGILEHLKRSKDYESYHTPVFQHAISTKCEHTHKLVMAEIRRQVGTATHFDRKQLTKLQKAELLQEATSQWEHMKAQAPFDKIGGPDNGFRKQTRCDHPEREPHARAREAKDLVAVLQASIVAQTTLANVAQSVSALGSEFSCKVQVKHADEVFNINAPQEPLNHHALLDNMHCVNLGAILHLAAIHVVVASHVLMEVRPVPCAHDGDIPRRCA